MIFLEAEEGIGPDGKEKDDRRNSREDDDWGGGR